MLNVTSYEQWGPKQWAHPKGAHPMVSHHWALVEALGTSRHDSATRDGAAFLGALIHPTNDV